MGVGSEGTAAPTSQAGGPRLPPLSLNSTFPGSFSGSLLRGVGTHSASQQTRFHVIRSLVPPSSCEPQMPGSESQPDAVCPAPWGAPHAVKPQKLPWKPPGPPTREPAGRTQPHRCARLPAPCTGPRPCPPPRGSTAPALAPHLPAAGLERSGHEAAEQQLLCLRVLQHHQLQQIWVADWGRFSSPLPGHSLPSAPTLSLPPTSSPRGGGNGVQCPARE